MKEEPIGREVAIDLMGFLEGQMWFDPGERDPKGRWL